MLFCSINAFCIAADGHRASKTSRGDEEAYEALYASVLGREVAVVFPVIIP